MLKWHERKCTINDHGYVISYRIIDRPMNSSFAIENLLTARFFWNCEKKLMINQWEIIAAEHFVPISAPINLFT